VREYKIYVDPLAQEEFTAVGNYVRIKSAPVDLRIENPANGDYVTLSAGDDFEFSDFQRLKISHESGIGQIFVIQIAKDKKGSSSRVAGDVSVNNFPASFSVSNLPLNYDSDIGDNDFSISVALSAGSNLSVFSDTYNTNGVVLLEAEFSIRNAGTAGTEFQNTLTATNPALTGSNISNVTVLGSIPSASGLYSNKLQKPFYLPAGYGLAWSQTLASTSTYIYVRWKKL